MKFSFTLILVATFSFNTSAASFIAPEQHHNSRRPNTSSYYRNSRTKHLYATRSSTPSRRSFVTSATILLNPFLSLPTILTKPDIANAVDINVTPMAHTFVTSTLKGKGTVKPVRENDFTRFLTNAKVVLLFSGETDDGGAREVTRLTQERKAGLGPGVTPGNVVISAAKKASSLDKEVSSLAKGDTLIVTVPTTGFSADKKDTADCASSLGLFLGGAKEGGVVSVLVDGSKSVDVDESAYDLLWYTFSR